MNDSVALAFEIDRQRFVKREVLRQSLLGGFVYVDHSWRAFAGDSAGQIDRIAPHVVNEFFLANDAGNDRAGANADAYS